MPKPRKNNKVNNNARDLAAVEVSCPGCGSKITWSAAFPQRPFCSERCKNNDFIGWANEQHQIAGSAEFDDVLSETLLHEQSQKLH